MEMRIIVRALPAFHNERRVGTYIKMSCTHERRIGIRDPLPARSTFKEPMEGDLWHCLTCDVGA